MLSSRDMPGSMVIMDFKAPAGFGPPRHVHRKDDEIFLVKRGHIALWTPLHCGTAGPGDLVALPAGLAHAWRACDEEAVEMEIITSPGEFETFFHDIVERDLTLRDVEELTDVASMAGMDILGPPLTAEEADIIFSAGRVY
ncbi:Cupin domain-containing protein [Rhizobium sp. NFR07]|nr:Cupin domain-containing protein [Rhizobium sp. NFR07]